MEIKNNNEKSLVNQVEYLVFDENKTILNLSLCNETNIKVFYAMKSDLLDMDSISNFKNVLTFSLA